MISTPLASNSSSVKQSSNSQSRFQYTQSNDSSSQHLGPQSQTNPSFPIVTHSEEYRNQDTSTTTPPTLQPVHKNTPINEMTDVEKYETAMDIPSVTPKHSQSKILFEHRRKLHSDIETPTSVPEQQQSYVSISPISRNPSSSEENNSEENSSERNPSNKSMSSLATSFESTSNRTASKYFEDSTGPLHPQMSQLPSIQDQSSFSSIPNINSDFAFPTSDDIPPSESSNISISTATRDNHYSRNSPKGTSSPSPHRLVQKPSVGSLGETRNFSNYQSSTPTINLGESTKIPTDSENSPISSPDHASGIALNRPIVQEDGSLIAAVPLASYPLDTTDSHEGTSLLADNDRKHAEFRSLPKDSVLRNSDRITVIPPPPHMNFNEARRDTSASGISLTSRGSLLNNDLEAKSSGSQQQSPMTIIRRRSFPPQLQQPGHDLAPDERADYYREQVIAMREKKRKQRKEYEEDERVLVGNKVSEGHANYAAAYYMLTGIRVSVSRCNAKVDHVLTNEDFTARHKLAFDVSGNELIPSSKYDFKFKDYAPWVFRHLRKLFNLDPADYLMSLTSKYIVSELSSPGKSGSFFYFSRDYRFIIKTIHHSEHKMLRKILKDYYNHVKDNPNTLVSQFYGLHRVKLPFGKKIHFIVMNNLFPPHHDLHRTYDLKGSSLGREYIPKKGQQSLATTVQKDINWIRNKESLKLGPIKSKQLLTQLEKDVALLKKLNVMDYSLLIGIHDKTKHDSRRQSVYVFEPTGTEQMKAAELRKAVTSTNPTAMSTLDVFAETFSQSNILFYCDDGGFQSTDVNNEPLSEIYYLGIIDYLTPYTTFKRLETFWKSMSHPRITISAIPANEYGDRFFAFMKKAVQAHKGQSSTTAPRTLRESVANDSSFISVVPEASNETSSRSS